jgi:hypothetical protein
MWGRKASNIEQTSDLMNCTPFMKIQPNFIEQTYLFGISQWKIGNTHVEEATKTTTSCCFQFTCAINEMIPLHASSRKVRQQPRVKNSNWQFVACFTLHVHVHHLSS